MFFTDAWKRFLIVLCILFILPNCFLHAQKEPGKNVIYIEGLGVGGLYSINYERFIKDDYSIRIGFTTWTTRIITTQSFTGVPIMGNYLIGKSNSKLELGVGVEYGKVKNVSFWAGNSSSDSGFAIISSYGYRYQPLNGGIHFRAVISNIKTSVSSETVLGISLGVCY